MSYVSQLSSHKYTRIQYLQFQQGQKWIPQTLHDVFCDVMQSTFEERFRQNVSPQDVLHLCEAVLELLMQLVSMVSLLLLLMFWKSAFIQFSLQKDTAPPLQHNALFYKIHNEFI